MGEFYIADMTKEDQAKFFWLKRNYSEKEYKKLKIEEQMQELLRKYGLYDFIEKAEPITKQDNDE